MEFKIVYNCENGSPIILKKEDVDQDYIYPEEPYTESEPTQGIYAPFYFDGNEWIGASKEEWESNLSKPPIEPKVLEMMVSKLQLQVMIGNKKTKELEDKLKVSEQTLADTVLKVTELENKIGGNA